MQNNRSMPLNSYKLFLLASAYRIEAHFKIHVYCNYDWYYMYYLIQNQSH